MTENAIEAMVTTARVVLAAFFFWCAFALVLILARRGRS